MSDLEQRLNALEQRLVAIETKLDLTLAPSVDTVTVAVDDVVHRGPPDLSAIELPKFKTSRLMALGAAASFILAAAYFVMLAHQAGWLTPTRQVISAFIAGLGLIALGQLLSAKNRDYAAYLPAVGLTIVYFAIYAAHLAYALIPMSWAIGLITVVSGFGLYIGWRFDHSVFAVLTACGVYLTPLLIRADFADLTVVVVYFSIWSLMFSFFALQEGRRATYLVALYLALTAFDATWRLGGSGQWALAAGYQFVQLLIFSSTAAAFSMRHRTAIGNSSALLHGIPLFYFYGLEFLILKSNAPALVVPLALASVVIIVSVFVIARDRLADRQMAQASASLVSAYAGFVTAHMLFFELLPHAYFAWGVMVLPVAIAFAQRQLGWSEAITYPLAVIGGILFVCGFFVALAGVLDQPQSAFPNLALLLYAAALYAVYYVSYTRPAMRQLATATLYMGHLSVLVTTIRVVESGLAISIAWAVYAIALLALALWSKTRELGQSSLIIFSASAFKVLIFDLDGSAPGLRIITLIILGGSLYLGGWLYQNLVRHTTPFSDDRALEPALRMVASLVERDFDNFRIAAILARREFSCPSVDGWNEDLVAALRAQHQI